MDDVMPPPMIPVPLSAPPPPIPIVPTVVLAVPPALPQENEVP